MGFIKKHFFLIIPTTVTLVAIVLLTVSILMAESLQQQLEESVSLGRRIASYKDQKISSSQWELERQYQQVHGRDANEISTRARESSQRELLSYKIFPEPKETSTQIFINFGRNYRQALESLIGSIGALDRLTDAELNSLLKQPTKEGESRAWGGPATRGDLRLTGRRDETESTIIELICKQRADTIPVYGNPAKLSGYEFWDKFTYAGRQDAIEKCWYSQISFWIQNDIIDTIKAMNAGSSSVFTSPVKRILGISFNSPVREQVIAIEDMPRYVSSPTEGLATPWTGRMCNDDIDVVHFNVSVVITSKAILDFMQELCSEKEHFFNGYFGNKQTQKLKHNQITVLRPEVRPVNPVESSIEGYYYGNDAIIRLDLTCEYIFNRGGYDAIKPKSIKQFLGQSEEDEETDEDAGSKRSRRRRRT